MTRVARFGLVGPAAPPSRDQPPWRSGAAAWFPRGHTPTLRWRVPHELLVSNCAELGRPLEAITLSTFREIYFPASAKDFPELSPLVLDPAKDPSSVYAGEFNWVVGPTPDGAIAALRPLVDAGVRQITLYFWDRRSLSLFIREVVPALR